MMLRMIALLAVAVVATGCTNERELPVGSTTPESSTDAASAGGDTTLDELLHAAWTDADGSSVDARVVNILRGPEHCDWQTSVWLHMGWPPGAIAEDDTQLRQYVRDPKNVLGLADGLDTHAALPENASATEFSADGVELWLGERGGDDAVYLEFPDHVERWPRSRQIIACA